MGFSAKNRKDFIKIMNRTTVYMENLQYIILIGLIIGQITVGKWYLFGQCVYLIADLVSTFRCFALDRPLPDKVKEVAFVGITLALIITTIIKNGVM